MSINLYSFVENPFTDIEDPYTDFIAYFNFDKFKDVVSKAQRLMDDVIDLEEEKINLILKKIEKDPEPEEIKAVEKSLWLKIKDKLLQGRRTGLSAIGLADCFAALDITYGSEESIELAEKIYKQFAMSAYKSSTILAKERGEFPIFSLYSEEENPYLTRIEESIVEEDGNNEYSIDVTMNGRRNIACLTIPPSGTISLLANISSGIEPVFQIYYTRRRKLEKDNPNITFIDQNGDGWEEYNVIHPKFLEWFIKEANCRHCPEVAIERIEKASEKEMQKIIKESPYYNATAYDIDPLQRVKLQATIQQYIDHSISSTINLPENISEKTISDIYIKAWESGCKGITIYRDNSRTGVLVSKDKKENTDFIQHDAPKRPKKLKAKVHKVKSKGILYNVIIGLHEDKPYEVFIISDQSLLNETSEYSIVKEKSKKYYITNSTLGLLASSFSIDLIENLTDEQAAITRLVSTALRHGANIKFIVEQLNKTHGDLTSFSKAIARALKTYIKDNEKTNKKCPECNEELIYEAGCETCKHCGYSKCG